MRSAALLCTVAERRNEWLADDTSFSRAGFDFFEHLFKTLNAQQNRMVAFQACFAACGLLLSRL
jgi:hypothetical protein